MYVTALCLFELYVLYSTLVGPSSECSSASHFKEGAPWSYRTLPQTTWAAGLFSRLIAPHHNPVSAWKPEISKPAEAAVDSIREKHPQYWSILQVFMLRTLGATRSTFSENIFWDLSGLQTHGHRFITSGFEHLGFHLNMLRTSKLESLSILSIFIILHHLPVSSYSLPTISFYIQVFYFYKEIVI